MDNNIHRDDDFDGYLQSLVDKEKQRQEMTKAHYVEWVEHFELLKDNFEQVMALFHKIGQVLPNWECSGPVVADQISRDAKEENTKGENPRLRKAEPIAEAPPSPLGFHYDGFYFRASLTHIFNDEYLEDEPARLKHEIEVNFAYSPYYVLGIGRIPEMTGYNKGYYPPSLEEVVGSKSLTAGRVKSLLKELDDHYIELKIWYNTNDDVNISEDCSCSIGIGYLYEHNLADLCKEVFKQMTGDDAENAIENIKKMFPIGDYPRRDPDENNISPALDDPKWRN